MILCGFCIKEGYSDKSHRVSFILLDAVQQESLSALWHLCIMKTIYGYSWREGRNGSR